MIRSFKTFRHIFTAHAQKRLFRSFRSKVWTFYLLRRPRFPITRVNFHYPMTFAAYILCFCAEFSFDLVTLTFDLLTLAMSDECTYQFLASYNYPFLSYVWLYLITIPSPGTVNAHARCHVTYHRGQKLSHFWNHWTQFYLFTLSLIGRCDKD